MAKTKKNDSQQQLDQLGKQIKSWHGKVVETYRKSLDHAKECGALLSKARDLCHTSNMPWSTWVKEHTGLSIPTCNGYIVVYEKWAIIEEANAQIGNEISTISGAVNFIRRKTREKKQPTPRVTTKGTTGTTIPRSLLQDVAARRGLTPDAILGLLTDLHIPYQVDDSPARETAAESNNSAA